MRICSWRFFSFRRLLYGPAQNSCKRDLYSSMNAFLMPCLAAPFPVCTICIEIHIIYTYIYMHAIHVRMCVTYVDMPKRLCVHVYIVYVCSHNAGPCKHILCRSQNDADVGLVGRPSILSLTLHACTSTPD